MPPKLLVLVLVLMSCSLVFSQEKGRVKGIVKHDGHAVEFANVYLPEINVGAVTDDLGAFEFAVPVGDYELVVSSIGFKKITKKVKVIKDETLDLEFYLKEDALGLDQVVVSGSRNEQNRREAPVIVSVTSEEVFKATQAISLSEGLNFQPGLRMETNCQNCGYSQVRMNGLNGAYSQILINSKPMFSSLNGVYGLEQIPANIVDRIEVVRGGGSALYGSNAIAGTINIITKEPIENMFEVASNVGFIDGEAPDKSLTLNGSIVNEKDYASGITFYGMYRDRNPYDKDQDGFTELTELENKTLGFNGYYKPGKYSKLSADFFTISEFRRGGNKLHLQPFESDITEQIVSSVAGGALNYDLFSPDNKLKTSFYVSGQHSKNDNFYGGKGDSLEESIKGYGNSENISLLGGGQLSNDFDDILGMQGTFTGGIEFQYQETEDAKPGYNAFIDQMVRVYGFYAQQELQLTERLKVLAGLRADVHNLTEKSLNINPRFNLLYDLQETMQLRASYAKGYRAPQYFTEDIHATLAAGEVSFVRFAPGLKSETSDSYVMSLDFGKSTRDFDVLFTVEGFYTRLNDPFITEEATEEELIAMGIEASEGQVIYLKKNSTGADVYGVNFEGKFAPSDKLSFQTGLTLQNSEYDEVVGWSDDESVVDERAKNFFKSPDFYGNFMINYQPVQKWENSISGVYTGGMYVPHMAGYIDSDRLEETPSFFELNIRTAYTFDLANHFQLQINGGIQNIFNSFQADFDRGADRDANYVYGPQRPRTFFIGLKIGTDLNR
ncbi:TonB-dependent receptor [Zhouia amylolytica]|uniref:TonB-dependent receptor n=1 Tax=Zhouia amylolytica AD3 TaxID=1286632 RepID=W2UM37_9FLAO|nr:TonB-dependent receptor [Zhouia amylolytica]ETN94516.1 hypothetical protein P278_24590 [Zhouia amylolytica AD3]